MYVLKLTRVYWKSFTNRHYSPSGLTSSPTHLGSERTNVWKYRIRMSHSLLVDDPFEYLIIFHP